MRTKQEPFEPFTELLGAAVDELIAEGMLFGVIAAMLDVDPTTLKAWMKGTSDPSMVSFCDAASSSAGPTRRR